MIEFMFGVCVEMLCEDVVLFECDVECVVDVECVLFGVCMSDVCV